MSVVTGMIGVSMFAVTVISGGDNLVFGITKLDALLCSAILILIAIWMQIGTIHHMMLEKQKEII
ncbi:MAG: hypothetical protein KA007_01055 [Candidatus Pacebacteria bacterium]|nr:hypothetical protein [Candidatus Paceibacterota bacterium]